MQCPAQSGAVHPTVLTCFRLLGKDGTPGGTALASPPPHLPQPAAEVAGDIWTLRDQEEKQKGVLTASALGPHSLPTPWPLVLLFSSTHPLPGLHHIPASVSFLWSHFLSTSLIPILFSVLPTSFFFFLTLRQQTIKYYSASSPQPPTHVTLSSTFLITKKNILLGLSPWI